MQSRFIYLNSKNVVGSSSEGRTAVPEFLMGNYVLEYFSMTNNLYNVNSDNNTLTVAIGGGANESFTIPAGNYTGSDLAAAVEVQLDTTDAFAVTFSAVTRKFTIVCGTTFIIRQSTSYRLLGLDNADDATATTHVSPNVCDLNTYKHMFVKLDESDDHNIQGVGYFSTSLFIPVNVDYGDVLMYRRKDQSDEQVVGLNIRNELEFKFHDDQKKLLSLNADWEMMFRKV